MQRYFAINKNLELEESDYHHIKTVMRMKPGDIIEVVYDGKVNKCTLNKDYSYNVISSETKESKNKKIIVAFALLKEQKLDYLFQKSTEVGASEFIPLISKRSLIKFDSNKLNVKLARWNKIVKEASEQSFRIEKPFINAIMDIKDLVKYDADLKILFTLTKNTKSIKKILQKNNNCDKILIVTGPEGGFDPTEEEYLIKNGFIPASLGDNVLRAETAPVVAIGMINYEFMR